MFNAKEMEAEDVQGLGGRPTTVDDYASQGNQKFNVKHPDDLYTISWNHAANQRKVGVRGGTVKWNKNNELSLLNQLEKKIQADEYEYIWFEKAKIGNRKDE